MAKQNKAKKIFTNLIIMVVVLTIIAAGLISVKLDKVLGFFIIGMLPGIVSYLTDSSPANYYSKTVIAFNLAGMAPQLIAILVSGSPNQTALSLLMNWNTWVLVYGFCGFGWLVTEMVPRMFYLYLTIKADYMVNRLKYLQEKMVEEWGDEIRISS